MQEDEDVEEEEMNQDTAPDAPFLAGKQELGRVYGKATLPGAVICVFWRYSLNLGAALLARLAASSPRICGLH